MARSVRRRQISGGGRVLLSSAYANLPTAVAAMQTGDTLLVQGDHTLTAPISSPAARTTIKNFPGTTPIITNNNAAASTYSFSVTHDDVKFQGLNFRGAFTNRRAITSTGNRTTIQSCIFDYAVTSSGTLAVLITNGGGHRLQSNTFRDTTVAFDGNVAIANTTVLGNSWVKVNHGAGTTGIATPLLAYGNVGGGHLISGNSLVNNVFAIGLSLGGTAPASDSNPANIITASTISNNTIDVGGAITGTSVGIAGMYVMGSSLTITDNVVYARSEVASGTGQQPSAFTSAYGTIGSSTIGSNATAGPTFSTISRNTFYSDGVAGGQTVRFAGTDNLFSYNTLRALRVVDFNFLLQGQSDIPNHYYGRTGWGYRHIVEYNTIHSAFDLPLAANDLDFRYNTVYGHSQAITTASSQSWDTDIYNNTFIITDPFKGVYNPVTGAQSQDSYICLAGLDINFYDNTIDLRGANGNGSTNPITVFNAPTTGVIERNTITFATAGTGWDKTIDLGGSSVTTSGNTITTV
jgi:hypothetical protein